MPNFTAPFLRWWHEQTGEHYGPGPHPDAPAEMREASRVFEAGRRALDADPVEVEQEIGETQRRVLDVLASVHDALVEDAIAAGIYSGPDAPMRAKNQVDRELLDVLVYTVRHTKRRLR
jgi:hypothetical protein